MIGVTQRRLGFVEAENHRRNAELRRRVRGRKQSDWTASVVTDDVRYSFVLSGRY